MKTINEYTLTEEQQEIVDGLNDFELLQVNIMLYDYDDLDNALDNYPNVEFYQDMNYTELAEQFVDDGLYGEINENISNYIDYEAIGRDLSFDYSEYNIDGECGLYKIY